MPDDLPVDDIKIRPAIALYGGAVDVDEIGTRIVRYGAVPPVFADTLVWDPQPVGVLLGRCLPGDGHGASR